MVDPNPNFLEKEAKVLKILLKGPNINFVLTFYWESQLFTIGKIIKAALSPISFSQERLPKCLIVNH